MKTTIMVILLSLSFSCTNKSQDDNTKKIYAINESVALKYSCQITADIVEGRDNTLELSINKINSLDDHLIGKIFVDYYNRLVASKLKFENYILKKDDLQVYSISQDQMSLLIARIDNKKVLVDQLQKDKSGIYNNLDESLKKNMSFEDFSSQMSNIYLGEMEFCGFIYSDTLMSLGYENKQNRLLLISHPASDKILGIEVQ